MKKETKMMNKYMDGFDVNRSCAVKKLKEMYSENVIKNELYGIGVVACSKDKTIPEIPRLAKRNLKALYKWFDSNWDKLYPILQYINIEDENGCIINQQRYDEIGKSNC